MKSLLSLSLGRVKKNYYHFVCWQVNHTTVEISASFTFKASITKNKQLSIQDYFTFFILIVKYVVSFYYSWSYCHCTEIKVRFLFNIFHFPKQDLILEFPPKSYSGMLIEHSVGSLNIAREKWSEPEIVSHQRKNLNIHVC